MAAGGSAPTNPVTASPSEDFTAGMPWIRSDRELLVRVDVDLGELELARSRARPRASIAGPSIRQGPHQAAQKSTTTGTSWERSITSRWKVSVVTFMLLSSLAVASIAFDECDQHVELFQDGAAPPPRSERARRLIADAPRDRRAMPISCSTALRDGEATGAS